MWYALPTGGNPDRTHIAQDGAALQPEQTCSGKPVSSGLEGLVCKHRDRAYRAGTSPDWVKVKNRKHPSIIMVKHHYALSMQRTFTTQLEFRGGFRASV
jgi:ATP-dependent DNA ligase